MSADARLAELGLTIPDEPATQLQAAYIMNGVLVTSGRTSPQRGKVGADLTVDEGTLAARAATLRALGAVDASLGSLDRVDRVLRIDGFVNCTADFTSSSKVIEGASALVYEVFGTPAGNHTRAAIGVAALPNGCAVEIVLTVAVTPDDSEATKGGF